MGNPAEKIVELPEAAETIAPARPAGDDTMFTARMQHEHLEIALKNWDFDSDSENSDPEIVPVKLSPAPDRSATSDPGSARTGKSSSIKGSTILKSAIALAVALVLGWMPLRRMLTPTSAEAVINARVITVRTPISGDVHAEAGRLEAGSSFQTGDRLLTVMNPRSDRGSLESLKRSVAELTTNLAALRAKEEVLRRHRSELAAQNERFQRGRVETLKRQLNEIGAEIAAAKARHSEAASVLARSKALFARGTVARAMLDKAVRDERMAAETIRQLNERRKASEVALAAARQGTFIADGYNDTPQSAQRSLDVELQLADVSARVSGTRKELESVKQDLAAETKREQSLSTAVIRASISGRVWETMTAPGEHVNAGQVLMRLLDCSSAIVTASVTESVFQKLTIGQSATFKPADGGAAVKGWVLDLSGLAAVASNDAIQAKLLSREPYHVTLKFPALSGRSCQISRAGLVTFDTSQPVESAAVRVGDAK